jgi:hypothetical protein
VRALHLTTHTSLLLAALLLLIFVASAAAQAGGQYDVTWNTVDSGGMTHLSAGVYTLSGTAGQPDAGVWRGGVYTLAGGFWGSPLIPGGGYFIYLPLVLRG